MLPEVAVIAGRAAAARSQLDALLGVVPEEHWERREAGELWTARNHLHHLATIDAPVAALLRAVREPGGDVAPFAAATMAEVEAARMDLLASVSALSTAELRARMERERAETLAVLATLDATDLERGVLLPGAVDARGRTVTITLRRYLAAWATHDTEHAQAIRRAISRPPGPGDLAIAARRPRR
ncbi:MAG: DinB family protein [Hyphomicrobiales bacterium]